MLFKDADVERKFFQRFLFDDENDDEDEEDNIVDKTLIKWTRAPKTVARARKEIVDVIDDETKNKLRIVSVVASPLEKCHKIEATCDGSNGEVYRVSVQMKTNTSFGGGGGDDDEDKKKNDNVFEEVTEATCECAHANKLSGKTRGRCKHSCAVLMVGLDHRRQSRIQKKTLMNNNNSPKGKALGANGDSSSGVTTGRMKRARKLPMSLLGGGKSGDGGEVEKSKKNKTAKATTQKTIRAVQTTTTKKKDDDEKADFLEDLLDDDGDEEEEEDEDGKKERLKKKRKKKRGRRRETSSSDSESDFEPFGAEVPMEHRMPTMSQRPTPPRRRRGRRGDADDGDDDEIEDMVEISDFSDGEELPPRRPAGIDGVAKAHANKKKALEAAECMTLETLRAACERRVERAASAKEIEEEEEGSSFSNWGSHTKLVKPVMVERKDVTEVDNDFWIVAVPIKDHTGTAQSGFPIENRLHPPQTADDIRSAIQSRSATCSSYAEKLRDFHLLLFLSKQMDKNDVLAIAESTNDYIDGGDVSEGYKVLIDAIAGIA
mmetsp:Transcript_1484/g.5458  ORF Transcript_1484/g.5458 Transcript_1484/m.5458 type:complete len:546 (-) Transcript_1484:62-1699(-)